MWNKLVIKELIEKYREIIRESWHDRNRAKNETRRDEMQFLPAVLEIQHTPPHPLPRVLLWLLCSFLLLTLLWSIVGSIDIVATANGKIIPSSFVKYIQPMNTATVSKILVKDGQYVKESELLIELDSTISEADAKKAVHDYQLTLLDSIKDHNLLARLDNKPLESWPESGMDKVLVENSKNQFDYQWLELQNKLQSIQAHQVSLDEAIGTSNAILSKYRQTLPMLKEKESDYLELYNKKFMSQHGYLDISKQRIELQQSVAEEQGKIREIKAQKEELTRQYQLTISDFKLDIGQKVLDADQKLSEAQANLDKAKQNQEYTALRAPVGGYVQQLAVHTVGGVVTPAQALMVIVPRSGGILAEVQLENKDVGFVHDGQEVEVKIAAFPFTRYGTIHGVVTSVSADAVADQKEQLLYNVYVKLDRSTMPVNGTDVYLNPGMMVTAEIKTGRRKLIDYFLSPLIQNTTEAFHER